MKDIISLPFGLGFLRKFDFPHKFGVLDRVYGRALAKHGECWVKTSSGIDWKLNLSDSTQRWIVYGAYEGRSTMMWMRSLFENGGVAIESGANIGQTLLYYIDCPDVQILAIDPLPKAISWLSECIDHHKFANIELINAGLSSVPTTLTLQQADAQSTFRTDWYKAQDLKTIEIACYPLDDIVRERNIESISLWKLDVEGMECEALEGASDLLSKKQIKAIYIEITGGNYDKVKELLAQYDYALFDLNTEIKMVPVTDPSKQGTHSYFALPLASKV